MGHYRNDRLTGRGLAPLKNGENKLAIPIAHVQIASVPDRHEPDHGECDYAAIFNALRERQFSGWIGCEYHPATQTETGLGWIEDA